MHKVFHPHPLEGSIELSDEESKHALRVMRLGIGDHVQVLNGNGQSASGEIMSITGKRCLLHLSDIKSSNKRSKRKLSIAIAPTKNNSRFEWFVEKATEIGIDQIIPILCEHSERRVLKTERIEKVAIAAMKQSGQVFRPHIQQLTPFKSLPFSQMDTACIAHCSDVLHTPQLKKFIVDEQDLTILVGPEGDFSESEVKFALDNHVKEVSLGASILRTETAGIFACVLANS